MGGCTSKRAAAVKAQQQSKCTSSAKPPKKKKKKSKAKIYSAFASMESLSNEIPVSHMKIKGGFFVLLRNQKTNKSSIEKVCVLQKSLCNNLTRG